VSDSVDLAAILDRTAWRYRQCDRFSRHYVASKLRRDPVHADVLALAAREPFGDVIDVGCGRWYKRPLSNYFAFTWPVYEERRAPWRHTRAFHWS